MELAKLRTNELSDEGWSWYQDYLAALDAYDLDRYAEFLADDVSVRFNNDEPLNIYGTDSALVLEALNHYDKPDSARISVRAAALTDRDRFGRVTSVRLYQDLSPLFAT